MSGFKLLYVQRQQSLDAGALFFERWTPALAGELRTHDRYRQNLPRKLFNAAPSCVAAAYNNQLALDLSCQVKLNLSPLAVFLILVSLARYFLPELRGPTRGSPDARIDGQTGNPQFTESPPLNRGNPV